MKVECWLLLNEYDSASYKELWSPDEIDYDSPEYYDLYDNLNNRICEEKKEQEEDKVCCSGEDTKVGKGL